ncbi:deSI-like protein At4g17486 [Telopea speciosissima]|uniref:deSI-like protein At4g17486 n=1 Tax=Telopea speciosissima TaxID=54955 RepID=UPI001CC580AE|nr:deSI-like protein At4g17486 [Telopea speciosissima]
MAQGFCEFVWLKVLLSDLGITTAEPMYLYCDNKAAIGNAHNPVQHDRTTHIEIDMHFVKEKLEQGSSCNPFVTIENQLANVLTKGLHCKVFHLIFAVHGMEFAFGAHEYPTSGVFEVEPKCCPGFVFRRSVLLGSTDMSRSEFRLFMEHHSGQYHGDSYHLIAKNCNHFTDDVCMRLTGKHIPGWVNRLARLGSFCNCLLPESIQTTTIRHLPDHPAYSDDGSDSVASSPSADSEEESSDHHLLTTQNGDVAFINEKSLRLAKDLL